MSEELSCESATEEREIRITRLFNAPRELVFEVWTTPEHTGHWWGPNGFTTTTASMEVRTGGQWRYVMHGPDGTDYQNLITYKEVIPPERLVYAHGSTDENPEQFQVTVFFAEMDGKTQINMQMLFKTKEERDQVAKEFGAIEGANQTMARLEAYLEALVD